MTESETIKKAIRHFECVKNDAVVVLDSGFGTRPGESNIVYRNRKMYAELAIQALEKQIPKKPVHDGCFDSEGMWHEWNGINGRPYDLCPNCNTNLCCEMHYDNKPKYCKHCGQKLDWSDKESEETKL